MLSLIIDIKSWSSFACFTARSGYKGMFSVADILHIADVIHQVLFLLFLLCFQAAIQLFLLHEMREMLDAISYQSTKTKQPYSQDFLFAIPFSGNYPLPFDVMFRISRTSSKFQWLSRISQKDLSQSEMEKYLFNEWMIINISANSIIILNNINFQSHFIYSPKVVAGNLENTIVTNSHVTTQVCLMPCDIQIPKTTSFHYFCH